MNENKVTTYIKKGSRDRYWYSDTQKLFEELFPGRLHLVTQLFAATSINSSLKSNIRLFRKALHDIDNGKPVGNYLPVMKLQIERIVNGEPIQGRKINSFAAAMSGGVNAVVVDIWLLRAFDEYKVSYRSTDGRERAMGATDKQYTFIEDWVREHAHRIGWEPRQVSAAIWSGIRGGVTRYDDILRHQIYNMYDNSNVNQPT